MNFTLRALLAHLDNGQLANSSVIPWSCPVLSFGSLKTSRIATLGLNPSNREFVDESGIELDGPERRFHTLKSLNIARWSEATVRHMRLIEESFHTYFTRNPYDIWFRKLDRVISMAGASYYGTNANACHLDLIPYATACKWTSLSRKERAALVAAAGSTIGHLLRISPVNIVVLNGSSVVHSFAQVAGVRLQESVMPNWSLPRKSCSDVVGIAYTGKVRTVANVELNRDVLVLGFNHNIQSSFGVTAEVIQGIGDWIKFATRGVIG
ncbi:hypothetical protein SOCE26_091020 [Sorangium cellulosum]|uniref:Uncharacterized protein n=1 Tax=Sorangium cellulosum TaxID=56 RepID=A0A2L0F7P6_SORCE|nr:hypothetical protein SOCE26_091020 [Sorangium cellulosum]